MGLPFPYGWYCWDLGEFRPFPTRYATYWLFPYETLPPLSTLDAPFAFLEESASAAPTPPWLEQARSRLRRMLTSLAGKAEDLGLTERARRKPLGISPGG
jgi:hypothetical protein